jgi:hypothetical protein
MYAKVPRPAQVCKALLAALEGAEGRRRKRKRDQTPDAIGLSIKRRILDEAVRDDPDPDRFEGWLLTFAVRAEPMAASATLAMARTVLDEWRLAHAMPAFAAWLERGAPTADAERGREVGRGEGAEE